MKRNIRQGVFETNSSSLHTLVISREGREASKFKLNKQGEIEVDFGQFGKEEHIYTSQYDKLSYLITCLYYLSGYTLENIYDNAEFQVMQDVICKYAGATRIRILGKQKPEIECQSIPEEKIKIIDTLVDDTLIDFVFNKYVSLKTDMD